MTIKFNCPNCDELIAFDDKHIGKRARCLTCGQIFVIPSRDNETPHKIKQQIQKGEPLPGFYHAVFVDSWKIFSDAENITTPVFVIAVVCFKFFLAGAICGCGHITFFIVWGWLLGFYLNIIYESALGIDKLPEIYLGTGVTFVWYVIKPFLLFFITFVVVQLPFLIALKLLQEKGVSAVNMWAVEFGPRLILQILFILGFFVFPIAILTVAVGRDMTLLRPSYLLKPISRAFIPYLLVVALLVAFGVLETQISQYNSELPLAAAAGRLILNLAVQIIAIITMRSIGLFYRHYNCHLLW